MPRCKKLKTKLKQNQFYCVSCCDRKTIHSDDMCVQEFKNKRASLGYTPALRSSCHTCRTPLTKFIKYSDVDRMVNKYGYC